MKPQKPIFSDKDILDRLTGKITFAEVPEKWQPIQGTYTRRAIAEIDGASIIDLPDFRTPANLFAELGRISKGGTIESSPEIAVTQWSYSTFPPNSPKAWHLHGLRDGQWDCWAIVPYPGMVLRVGLWDIRKSSLTSDAKLKTDFDDSGTRLVLIPPGVAHGVCAFEKQGILFYITTKMFDKQYPDEGRIPWDMEDKDFWMSR
ncbi:MAG TPA: dTDP-4-dehydrorhamnose 3,5-epimerase family protein [Patescibacteria group bacterium]|nr:dTDP-4-dehydrorhamnose 3,5-epimerase family protein [Patescibacteria group bacterium]